RFTVGQPDHFPEIGLSSIAWNPTMKSSFAEPMEDILRSEPACCSKVPSEGWWSRWVTLPHKLACRASALLVCHDPKMKMAGCLRAARSKLSFGDSAAC